jgi:tetratricopeptide (TPR) repeat protein
MEAKAFEKDKRWDEALDKWEQVKRIDPAHDDAARTINQIKGFKRDKANLDNGRVAFKAKRYGEAAKLFRRIRDDSPYFVTAKGELDELSETKDSLIIQARTLLNRRASCDELTQAGSLLDQIQRIDANDSKVGEMVSQREEFKRKKRCTND